MSHLRTSVSILLSSAAIALCGCATSSPPPLDETAALAALANGPQASAPAARDATQVRAGAALTASDLQLSGPAEVGMPLAVPVGAPIDVPWAVAGDLSLGAGAGLPEVGDDAEAAAAARAAEGATSSKTDLEKITAAELATSLGTPLAQGRDATNDWRGSGHFMIGYRHFFDEGWGDLENQPVVGIEFEFRPPNSGLGFEIGAQVSADFENNVGGAAVDLLGLLGELYAGPRYTFDVIGAPIHPYIGAGVTLARARLEVFVGNAESTAYDTALAGYGHAGLMYEATQHLDIGIDVRGTFGGEIDVGSSSVDMNYVQGTFFMGASW